MLTSWLSINNNNIGGRNFFNFISKEEAEEELSLMKIMSGELQLL
jgi:hypothetical protein